MTSSLSIIKTNHDFEKYWVHPKLGNITATILIGSIGGDHTPYIWTINSGKYYIDGKDIGKVKIKLVREPNDVFWVTLRTVDESGVFDGRYEYTFRSNREIMTTNYSSNDYDNSFYAKHTYNTQEVIVGKLLTGNKYEEKYKASYDASNNILTRN